MKPKEPTTDVGVMIGRFQTPELHRGQKQTIDEVFKRHKKVLILIGVSPVRLSRINPLDYVTRELMIKKVYPRAVCLPVKDCSDDVVWSKGVDHIIEAAVGDSSVTLYGSRDSFIPHYHGRYGVVELPASLDLSGTAARAAASQEVRSEKGYRVGIIYAGWNRFPISYQCVDAIVWRRDTEQILLGRKKDDPPDLWRFPGGFVDPKDESLEMAAVREAMEETGAGQIALHEPRYLFSMRVEDWRYRKERDKIMTAVFSIEYQWGSAKATDDLDQVKWFSHSAIGDAVLVLEHRALWAQAKKHFP